MNFFTSKSLYDAAFRTFIYAQEAPANGNGASPPGSPIPTSLIFMLLIFAIFWFLLIRPSQKRERERREMLARLGKGDNVVTSGGICGTIVGLNDKTVVLKVSDDPVMKMEFVRGAVQQITSSEADEKKR